MAIDPDAEVIIAAAAGPANKGDGELLPELLDEPSPRDESSDVKEDAQDDHVAADPDAPIVYGDSAYGSGKCLAHLDDMGAVPMTKCRCGARPKVTSPRTASAST
ncbi:MAG: hypothetical protein H0V97_01395 [Actinobacteria bacterium]|nr:hypothetical protein [Actinomycetota bacterium]